VDLVDRSGNCNDPAEAQERSGNRDGILRAAWWSKRAGTSSGGGQVLEWSLWRTSSEGALWSVRTGTRRSQQGPVRCETVPQTPALPSSGDVR
jgi:hypothetical protein